MMCICNSVKIEIKASSFVFFPDWLFPLYTRDYLTEHRGDSERTVNREAGGIILGRHLEMDHVWNLSCVHVQLFLPQNQFFPWDSDFGCELKRKIFMDVKQYTGVVPGTSLWLLMFAVRMFHWKVNWLRQKFNLIKTFMVILKRMIDEQ